MTYCKSWSWSSSFEPVLMQSLSSLQEVQCCWKWSRLNETEYCGFAQVLSQRQWCKLHFPNLEEYMQSMENQPLLCHLDTAFFFVPYPYLKMFCRLLHC